MTFNKTALLQLDEIIDSNGERSAVHLTARIRGVLSSNTFSVTFGVANI